MLVARRGSALSDPGTCTQSGDTWLPRGSFLSPRPKASTQRRQPRKSFLLGKEKKKDASSGVGVTSRRRRPTSKCAVFAEHQIPRGEEGVRLPCMRTTAHERVALGGVLSFYRCRVGDTRTHGAAASFGCTLEATTQHTGVEEEVGAPQEPVERKRWLPEGSRFAWLPTRRVPRTSRRCLGSTDAPVLAATMASSNDFDSFPQISSGDGLWGSGRFCRYSEAGSKIGGSPLSPRRKR